MLSPSVGPMLNPKPQNSVCMCISTRACAVMSSLCPACFRLSVTVTRDHQSLRTALIKGSGSERTITSNEWTDFGQMPFLKLPSASIGFETRSISLIVKSRPLVSHVRKNTFAACTNEKSLFCFVFKKINKA